MTFEATLKNAEARLAQIASDNLDSQAPPRRFLQKRPRVQEQRHHVQPNVQASAVTTFSFHREHKSVASTFTGKEEPIASGTAIVE